MTLPIAIILSGRGSNMQAIHRAILSGRLDAEIRLILSDQIAAPGLQYAKQNNIPHAWVEKTLGESREAFDRRLLEKIEASGSSWVILAGYMRILSPVFIRHFSNHILNIHPSLLPAFPGLHAQRQALTAGVKEAGCTVHFVDEGCDTGPIVAQRRVPVLPEDSEDSLSARILEQEHQLYPTCIQWAAEGKLSLEGGKVKILGQNVDNI